MVDLAVGLTIGLAIAGAELTSKEVAVGFLGWSLWNELISFLRYCIAKTGFQVFFSSVYLFYATR